MEFILKVNSIQNIRNNSFAGHSNTNNNQIIKESYDDDEFEFTCIKNKQSLKTVSEIVDKEQSNGLQKNNTTFNLDHAVNIENEKREKDLEIELNQKNSEKNKKKIHKCKVENFTDGLINFNF